MPLDVIGAGFGRTGTFSLRTALNKLGFPCYHMMDVLFDPAHKSDVDFWLEVAEDPARADRDWTRVFAGVSATVDYPACAAWRGMVAANPQAKVIATLHPRGAAAWFESTRNTIYAGTGLDAGSCFGAKINAMMDRLVWHGMLQGTMEHRQQPWRAMKTTCRTCVTACLRTSCWCFRSIRVGNRYVVSLGCRCHRRSFPMSTSASIWHG